MPHSYSGQALKVIRVNAGETGLEFASGGGGTPASPDTSIQFNDGGSFGGDADFTWDKTNKIETIGGDINFTSDSVPTDRNIKVNDQNISHKAGNKLVLQAGSNPVEGDGGNLDLNPGFSTSIGSVLDISIINAGSGYTATNVVTILAGDNNATVRIDTVDGGGAVLTYTILNQGTGYTDEQTNISTSGGSGSSFTVLTFTNIYHDGSINFLGGIGTDITFGYVNGTHTLANILGYNGFSDVEGQDLEISSGGGGLNSDGGDTFLYAGQGGNGGIGGGVGNGGDLTVGAGFGYGSGKVGGDLILFAGEGDNGATNGKIKIMNGQDGVIPDIFGILDVSLLTTSDKTFTFPDASGTIALQTGASGSFTTVDLKTVTVVNGIITSIV